MQCQVKDISPYVVRGGIASHNEVQDRFAEEICDAVTLENFDKTLL